MFRAGGSKFCLLQHTCSSLPYMNTVTSRSDLREPRGRKNHCKLAHWKVGLIVCCTFQLCVKWGSTNTGWHIDVFFFTYKIGMGHSWLIWVGHLRLIRWGICGLLGETVYGKVSYCYWERRTGLQGVPFQVITWPWVFLTGLMANFWWNIGLPMTWAARTLPPALMSFDSYCNCYVLRITQYLLPHNQYIFLYHVRRGHQRSRQCNIQWRHVRTSAICIFGVIYILHSGACAH